MYNLPMSGQGDMGLAQRSFRKLTHEDYLRLPDDGRRHQIIDGVHHVSPSPTLQHQRIVRQVYDAVSAHVRREAPPPGEVCFAPLDVILSPHDVVQPDVLYVSHERRRILRQWVHGAPDLVIEVLSPTTRGIDTGAKLAAYERAGVAECWLVDPECLSVTVYRRGAGGRFARVEELRDPEASVSTPLLPGFAAALSTLFV
jgi:Uma2 family endonuclease